MSHKRYVVMSNGKGIRWGDHLGIPKQLIEIEGETLLKRIVRQVRQFEPNAEIVISSSDSRHETEGARRHEPLVNEIELDRFVDELLIDDTCFLYGDTFYTDAAMFAITNADDSAVSFYGDHRSITGISCRDASVLREHLTAVREAYLSGRIANCIGWQVYQSYCGQLFEPLRIGDNFIRLEEQVAGFNSPEDLRDFMDHLKFQPGFALSDPMLISAW